MTLALLILFFVFYFSVASRVIYKDFERRHELKKFREKMAKDYTGRFLQSREGCYLIVSDTEVSKDVRNLIIFFGIGPHPRQVDKSRVINKYSQWDLI